MKTIAEVEARVFYFPKGNLGFGHAAISLQYSYKSLVGHRKNEHHYYSWYGRNPTCDIEDFGAPRVIQLPKTQTNIGNIRCVNQLYKNKSYSLLNFNCAHCVLYILNTLGYTKDLPLPFGLTPKQVAKIAMEIKKVSILSLLPAKPLENLLLYNKPAKDQKSLQNFIESVWLPVKEQTSIEIRGRTYCRPTEARQIFIETYEYLSPVVAGYLLIFSTILNNRMFKNQYSQELQALFFYTMETTFRKTQGSESLYEPSPTEQKTLLRKASIEAITKQIVTDFIRFPILSEGLSKQTKRYCLLTRHFLDCILILSSILWQNDTLKTAIENCQNYPKYTSTLKITLENIYFYLSFLQTVIKKTSSIKGFNITCFESVITLVFNEFSLYPKMDKFIKNLVAAQKKLDPYSYNHIYIKGLIRNLILVTTFCVKNGIKNQTLFNLAELIRKEKNLCGYYEDEKPQPIDTLLQNLNSYNLSTSRGDVSWRTGFIC